MTVSIVPRGTAFARYIKALAIGKGDPMAAEAYAEAQGWRSTPSVATALKAAVNEIDSDSLTAAMGPIATDFAEFLRPMTILGKMTGFRRVPFKTRMVNATIGGEAAWAGEGLPIPATSPGFDLTGTLEWAKLSAIAVITDELARLSTPQAELAVAADVAKAIAEKLDLQFIDPASTGTPDVSPASVTAGATQHNSSGSTLAAIDADLEAMVSTLVSADMPLSTAHWVLHPITATRLALLRGSSGAPAYPQITARGGSLIGLPVITSTAMTASGSPGERSIALVEAGEINLADDGGAELEFSKHASLQMSTTPSAGATALRSMWQNGLVAVRGTRFANWKVRKSGATVVLRNVVF